MPAQVQDIARFEEHSSLLCAEYTIVPGSTDQYYQLQAVTEPIEIDTEEFSNGLGCARGIFLALAMEAAAGVGIYVAWTLLRLHR